ncbi:MAG: YkvA family protein [Sphingomonadales bacterium]
MTRSDNIGNGETGPISPEMALVPVNDAATNEARVRRGFCRKLRRVAGRIPFAEDLATAYYCATDSRTPARVRAILFAGLAYFVIPADFIPDFIVAFGFTDDAAVLMAVIASVSSHITDRHRERARRALHTDTSEDGGS